MVGLVNYDSDESEDSVQSSQLSSNNRLPPLPCSFYNVYTSNPKLSEDPGFHEGRTREIAHVQGGWPSHIYLEYLPKEPEFSVLKFIYNDAIAQSRIDSPIRRCVSLLESELLVQKPLHVSLSVTLMVPTESKQKLLDQVRAAVNLGRSRPTQTPHTVQYAMEPVVQCVLSYTLRILSNPQKTRAFLVILIDSPDQVCVTLMHNVRCIVFYCLFPPIGFDF